ncbi:putative signal peptide-containing protein [Acinetobacter baumannii 496487]|nr:putative signal peptide-containing protein [Acinetobacter baumannii 1267820]EXC36456.1 putative signal peptide-containing protein [Acinetobacter baumannii 951631]EXE67927.1 putative signal peptide-containing protein [Acinetobacter baumannii 397971]EXG12122.1 putative signal peptide-containing protein [Acinetobacter baumannii 722310]EXH49626.1 putative signal peptide-containing protein [Acinetobacter baumannii 1412924]EXH57056.1 putative signal peptide-containing protein [Acinetobacter bauma
MFNSALHETNSPQPDTSSFLSKLKEPTQPKNVSLNSNHSQSVSADTVPFYDTKSDPSIQPIDPEKDPANEIKAK